MKLSDITLGAILIALGIAVGLYSMQLPSVPGQPYGPSLFPTIIGAAMAVCGAVSLVGGLRRRGVPLVAFEDWAREPRAVLALFAIVASTVIYILASRSVGFVPLATAMLLVLFRLGGVGWRRSVTVAILAAFATDYVFRNMLLVPLPMGLMRGLVW